MRILLLLFSLLVYASDVEKGETYTVKKLKYFAPKGEDKNSVAHFILYRDAKRKHVVEVFCLIPFGEDPSKAKRVTIGDRSRDVNATIEYFCDLEK